MVVWLRPMNGSELAAFLVTSRAGYVAERVTSGDDALGAAHTADEQLAAMFPGGRPAPGHQLFCIDADGERVGALWIGPPSDERPGEWWVWDIVVDEPHRGRGLGKEIMLRAEDAARSNGATHLGLSVLGHNLVARSLYESLGYTPVPIRMSKPL